MKGVSLLLGHIHTLPYLGNSLKTCCAYTQVAVQQELSNLEGAKERVTEQFLDTQEQLATERAAFTSRNNSLQSDVDKLTAQHMLTLNKLEATSARLAEVMTSHEALKTSHADLEKKHTVLQDSSAATTSELQALQATHAGVVQTFAEMQTQVAQLSSELSSAEFQVVDMRKALADSEAARSALDDSLTALQAESENRVAGLRQELQSVTEQAVLSQASVGQLGRDLTDLDSQYQSVKQHRAVRHQTLTEAQLHKCMLVTKS